ncbi:MAG: metallophosphoesterase [Eubacterium sp.]|nr:metallophosphoesterase [Eubacterium sp.]
MKILIISDTHGFAERLPAVLKKTGPVDILIHAGDIEGQEDYIAKTANCPLYIVSGNNDWFSSLSRELTFMLGDYRVFLTHGHNYGIALGTEMLRDEAVSRRADIVICGHTHRPMIEKKNNLVLLNPGSLGYPRQIGRRPSYIMMTIDKDHLAHFEICELDR